jgi:TolA-binding protein
MGRRDSKVVAILKGETEAAHCFAVSPDGAALAVARGRNIQLWKLGPAKAAPGNKEADKEGNKAAAKSADEKAAELLAQAKETLKAKNESLARIRLRNIVSQYPKTPAAAEARMLLKSLEK